MNSQEILQLFDDGCTWGQIRLQAKIGWARMQKILKKGGRSMSFKERNAALQEDVPSTKSVSPVKSRRITAEQKKQILQLFDEGNPRQEIERRLGISQTAVRRVISRADRSFIQHHKTKVSSATKEQKQMIHELTGKGYSQKRTATHLGLTRWAVQCELKAAEKRADKKQNAILDKVMKRKIVAGDNSCPSEGSSTPTTSSVENHIICTANIPRRSVRGKKHPEPEVQTEESDVDRDECSVSAGNPLASFDNFFGGAYHLSKIANNSGIPLDTVRQTLLSGTLKLPAEPVLPLRSITPESITPVVMESEERLPGRSDIKEAYTFRCNVCDLSWDDQNDFLSHLLAEKHRNLTEQSVPLTCTGCRFRSRQPLKMGRHVISYQTDKHSDGVTNVHAVAPVPMMNPKTIASSSAE